MATYHIHKKSRAPGTPYQGPTCDRAGVKPGRVYETEAEAQIDADKLSEVNPVGFEVSPILH